MLGGAGVPVTIENDVRPAAFPGLKSRLARCCERNVAFLVYQTSRPGTERQVLAHPATTKARYSEAFWC